MLPESRKDQLREQIIAAFAETPYPGDDRITEPTFDDEGIADYFRGKTWRGHAVKTLRYHSVGLGFFTPDAFRYYLPAYMLASLEDPDAADIIPDDTWNRLLPVDAIWDEDRKLRMFCLSPTERQAVAAFILYLADEKADYWEPPLYNPDHLDWALEELTKLEAETVAILESLEIPVNRQTLLSVNVRKRLTAVS